VRRILGETAIVAAVNLTKQVRHLQENNGRCEGCASAVERRAERRSRRRPEMPDVEF
jgi:hypothetical protein